MIIISSPSGGGKDAVIRALLKIYPNSARLVTTTTRPMRKGDENGKDYYFLNATEFKNKIDNNEFLEYNFYSGNYYGTEKEKLEKTLKNHPIVFTNIDVNGKIGFDKAKINNFSIFLLPENEEILRQRIIKRGGTNKNDLEKRIELAKKEVKLAKKYDFCVLNKEGELENTILKVKEAIDNILDKKTKIS